MKIKKEQKILKKEIKELKKLKEEYFLNPGKFKDNFLSIVDINLEKKVGMYNLNKAILEI